VSYNFIRYDQEQQHLLAKSVADWIEEDSLERFVSDTVDYLDEEDRLEPFYPEASDDGRGRPQYHPVLMLKILIFGYCVGVRSSRQLDRLLERDIAFRYLAANQQPDFRTISLFRKHHREEFEQLFVEIVELCREVGMVDLGEVAIDGRRVQGDSALEANRTREQIEEEIQEILDEAAAIDQKEDEEYGPEKRGDELPEELRDKQDRLDRLREAKRQLDQQEEQLKEEQREKIRERDREAAETGQKKRGRNPKPPEDVELDDDTKANVTDPESQTLKTHDGWAQGYNGQAAVDTTFQIIVAQYVTTDANDVNQLEPVVEQCEDIHDERPENVLADAGYWQESITELQDEQTELYVATTKDWKRRKELAEQGPPVGRIPDDYGPKELMERKLRTKPGRCMYRKRAQTVEPVFGQHVNRGCDRFMLGGKKGAQAEWSLFSATHNLLKLWRADKSSDVPVVANVISR